MYLYGNDPASRRDEGPKATPRRTYLASVPSAEILVRSAKEFFAGFDSAGETSWSADSDRMMPVFTDRNANRAGCGGICGMESTLQEAFYDPALERYLGVAQGDYVAQTPVYEAPEPWGPWSVVAYNNIDAQTGAGGWANLHSAGDSSIGAHIVNAWTSASRKTLWFSYSAGGKAPAGALFPPAGTSMGSLNLVEAELNPAPAP